jgi:hypothetical protein
VWFLKFSAPAEQRMILAELDRNHHRGKGIGTIPPRLLHERRGAFRH